MGLNFDTEEEQTAQEQKATAREEKKKKKLEELQKPTVLDELGHTWDYLMGKTSSIPLGKKKATLWNGDQNVAKVLTESKAGEGIGKTKVFIGEKKLYGKTIHELFGTAEQAKQKGYTIIDAGAVDDDGVQKIKDTYLDKKNEDIMGVNDYLKKYGDELTFKQKANLYKHKNGFFVRDSEKEVVLNNKKKILNEYQRGIVKANEIPMTEEQKQMRDASFKAIGMQAFSSETKEIPQQAQYKAGGFVSLLRGDDKSSVSQLAAKGDLVDNSLSLKGAYDFNTIIKDKTKRKQIAEAIAPYTHFSASQMTRHPNFLKIAMSELSTNSGAQTEAAVVAKTKTTSEQNAKAAEVMKLYQHSNATPGQFASGTVNTLLDPLNVFTGGAGSLAVKGVEKSATKTAIKKMATKETTKLIAKKKIESQVKKAVAKKIAKSKLAKASVISADAMTQGAMNAIPQSAMNAEFNNEKDIVKTVAEGAARGALAQLVLGHAINHSGKGIAKIAKKGVEHSNKIKLETTLDGKKKLTYDGKTISEGQLVDALDVLSKMKPGQKEAKIDLMKYRKSKNKKIAEKILKKTLKGEYKWTPIDKKTNEAVSRETKYATFAKERNRKLVQPENHISKLKEEDKKQIIDNYIQGWEIAPTEKGERTVKQNPLHFVEKRDVAGRRHEIKTTLGPKTTKVNKGILKKVKRTPFETVKELDSIAKDHIARTPEGKKIVEFMLPDEQRAHELDFKIEAAKRLKEHKKMKPQEKIYTENKIKSWQHERDRIKIPEITKEERKKLDAELREYYEVGRKDLRKINKDEQAERIRRISKMKKTWTNPKTPHLHEQMPTDKKNVLEENLKKYIQEHKDEYNKAVQEELESNNLALTKPSKKFLRKTHSYRTALADMQNIKTEGSATNLHLAHIARLFDDYAKIKDAKLQTDELEKATKKLQEELDATGAKIKVGEIKVEDKKSKGGQRPFTQSEWEKPALKPRDDTFIKKALDYHFNNPQLDKAWRNNSGLNIGQTVLDKEELELIHLLKTKRDAGQISDTVVGQYKEAMIRARTKKRKQGQDLTDYEVKDLKKKLIKSSYEMRAEKMGLDIKKQEKKVWWIKVHNTILDFKNSVTLNAGLIFNSKRILDMYNNGIDFRTLIADKIGRTDPDLGVNKDIVKKIFVPSTYGQGLPSAIKNIAEKYYNGDLTKAERAINLVYKELEQYVPELVILKEKLTEKIQEGKAISFKLPDGVKIEIKPEGERKGEVIINGKKAGIKVSTKDTEMGVGIIPAFMISVDAYMYRRIQEKAKIIGAHDSMIVGDTFDKWAVTEAIKQTAEEMSKNKLGQNLIDQIFGKDKVHIGGEPTDVIIPAVEKMIDAEGISDLETKKIGNQTYQKVEGDLKIPSYYGDDNMVIMTAIFGQNKANLEPNMYKNWRIEAFMQNPAKPAQSDIMGRIAYAAMKNDKKSIMKMTIKGITQEGKEKLRETLGLIYDEARIRMELNPNMEKRLKGQKIYTETNLKQLKESTRNAYKAVVDNYVKKVSTLMEDVKSPYTLEVRKELPSMITMENYPITKAKVDEILRRKQFTNIRVAKAGIRKPKSEQRQEVEKQLLTALSFAKQVKTGISDFVTTAKAKTGYFSRQYAKNPTVKAYFKLFNRATVARHKVEEASHLLGKSIENWVKKSRIEENELHDMLIKKNASWLMHLSNEELDNVVTITKEARKMFKPYVKQAAKGLGQQSHMVGEWRNNPRAFLDEIYPDMKAETKDKAVEKLENAIVVEALGEEGINWIKKNRDNENIRNLAEVHRRNQLVSKSLFADNPNNYIFGYTKEYWKTDVTDKAKTRYNKGIIGVTLTDKKIGTRASETYLDKMPIEVKVMTPQEIREWCRQYNLKIDAKGFRKVAEEKWKLENGMEYNIAEELKRTYADIGEKQAQAVAVSAILEEAKKNSLIVSKTKKENMVEIPKETLDRLPYEIRDIKYVHKDFVTDYLGKEEHRILGSAINKYRKIKNPTAEEVRKSNQLEAIDRSLREVTLRFKRANTLLSPKSWTNAFIQNYTLGAMAGMSPVELAKYTTESFTSIREYQNLVKELTEAEALNKDVKQIKQKLKNNKFGQLVKEGLAVNLIDGEVVTDSMSREKWDKIISRFPQHMQKGLNNILGVSGTWTEQKAIQVYSMMDSMGRYMYAMHQIENGTDREWAIRNSNSMFGDMRQLAPSLIEIMDKYPLAPFTHWGSQTLPMLAHLTKSRPILALAITGGAYLIGQQFEMDTDSYSPVAGAVDFAADELPTIPAIKDVKAKIIKAPIQTILPGYITKPLSPSLSGIAFGYDRDIRPEDVNRYIYSPQGEQKEIRGEKIDTRRPFQKIIDKMK